MRVICGIFVIFLLGPIGLGCVSADEEFFTIWSPKAFHKGKDYNVVVLPSNLNLNKRAEVTLKIGENFGTKLMAADIDYKMRFIGNTGKKSRGWMKQFKMDVIISRNQTSPKPPQCLSKKIENISGETLKTHTFIQLDKPIYKPNDEIKFRVFVLDSNLDAQKINNIEIKFLDPLKRVVRTFDTVNENYLGVVNDTFKLSEHTPLGRWTISVEVERSKIITRKTFSVSKYTLPEFSVHIEAEERHILINSTLSMKFYAKYSFGDFVKGNANVSIINPKTQETLYNKPFAVIKECNTVEIDITKKFMVGTESVLELIAIVDFTEAESMKTFNSTMKFFIHASNKRKLVVNKPKMFLPGLPFSVEVFPFAWNEKAIKEYFEPVVFRYIVHYDNGTASIPHDVKLKDGVAYSQLIVPEKAKALDLEVTFVNVVEKESIKMGEMHVKTNELKVTHSPKLPKTNDPVTIYFRSYKTMDKMILIAMSRFGNVESHRISCNHTFSCKYNITISAAMAPTVKVLVYQVLNRNTMYQGSTDIELENLGKNRLSMSIEPSARTRDDIKMEFSSLPDSHIYLLAYDKRLTFIHGVKPGENEVGKKDIVESVANFDGNNIITTISEKNKWRDCTNEEIEWIEKGRLSTAEHTGDGCQIKTRFDVDEEAHPEETITQDHKQDGDEADDVRDDFPETWIFDDFQIDGDSDTGIETRTYKVPESITSWKISAIAMHSYKGIAIAKPTELIVKNEFFLKMILPYSIRYQEILRVDILVFNYITSGGLAEVDVTLFNKKGEQFQFVNYGSKCASPSFSNSEEQNKKVTVAKNSVKRVSFYIRPLENIEKKKYFSETIAIKAHAKTKGNLQDVLVKKLKIEKVGFKVYEFHSESKLLNNTIPLKFKNEENNHSLENQHDENFEYSKYYVSISGEYVSEKTDMAEKYRIHNTNCLEQRTSLLKGNVEYYRYRRANEKNPPKPDFSTYYQEVLQQGRYGHVIGYRYHDWDRNKWTYGDKSGFKAYFLDIVASAMEMKLLEFNKTIIGSMLDEVKQDQYKDGYFKTFGTVPCKKDLKTTTDQRLFETAYVLIPFLRFRQFFNKTYDDVIDKGLTYIHKHINVTTNMEVNSLSAIALALKGKTFIAKLLLDKTDKHRLSQADEKECLTLGNGYSSCDQRHTAYACIAHMMLNNTKTALPLMRYLVDGSIKDTKYDYTFRYAITVEAIARVAERIAPSDEKGKSVNFKVNIRNEDTYDETVHIDKGKAWTPQVVAIPDFSKNVYIKAEGHGFCAISIIRERMATHTYANSTFIVTAIPLKKSNVVRVCAIYNTLKTTSVLTNVIYDVELPSGYEYANIQNTASIDNIRNVLPRYENSRVSVYFEDFVYKEEYCINIQAIKKSEVKNAQNAYVQVYDFDEKENYGLAFYKFSTSSDSPACA